ncbi:MAG: acetate--CoA ligase family protein [Desulfobacteraceae bacterium]|nr:acetate--CoA ligase family protein [Desulfobacteraceae bacterium]
MHKFFSPDSIALFGLSSHEKNVPRLVLENLIRWGFEGRIFGVHPKAEDEHVRGITMYKSVEELPEVPDLGVILIPAHFVPDIVEGCGKKGVKRLIIMSGGFNEAGEKGEELAEKVKETARKYNIRFMGPNCIATANSYKNLCLPFVPNLKMDKGGFSLISQSGGLGIFQWNSLGNENLGFSKFASIGNKLDVTEAEVLEYFGNDPETKVIGMYLENISDGKALIEAAEKIDKPVLIYKANRTSAGQQAAMSHTAALSNDDEIVDTAFERAGIIRVKRFNDFINYIKAFEMPPMKGDRIMVMSPAGGFGVMMSDICEEEGFRLADPGEKFKEKLSKMGNAGIIDFKNPLDLGDIYEMKYYGDIFHTVLNSSGVDGAVFLTQWPDMPGKSNDIFTNMFHTDVSKEILGAVRSSNKPVGVTLFGSTKTIDKIKKINTYPLFDSPDDMIHALKKQSEFYMKKSEKKPEFKEPEGIDPDFSKNWIKDHKGEIGEEFLDFLKGNSIEIPKNTVVTSPEEAAAAAGEIGYPVVMKVVSKDALHKSDIGGVLVNIKNESEVLKGFDTIKNNLLKANPNALFEGVRIMEMAKDGYDMFIGSKKDDSFGQVIYFGFGGIFIEVFKDAANILCPSYKEEIEKKLHSLKSFKILEGARGGKKADVKDYADLILKLSFILEKTPEIKELDLNPVRIIPETGKAVVLDARASIE